ncbi:hypothetical protein OROHE_007871 [Orobanche hederae]
MEAGPWEALDLDDSDLPSLLRPCKRRRPASPITTAANPLSQLTSTQSPERHFHKQQRQPPPGTAHSRSIPGPAGAVQAAMLRKDLDRENQNFTNCQMESGEGFNGNHPCEWIIPTQDYIMRAMEDTADFDDDFSLQPWISALQFLGANDGYGRSTPVSSIKKCLNGDKVAKVVAVIKSCTPNGLGGLIVSLKDPTGTVGASIHHKVLSDNEFGKNLTVGSVLILRKVAVFSPAKSAHYLNITLRNLVKVIVVLQIFCQNGASASKLIDSAHLIQHADPGIENCEKAKTMENMSTMQNVTIEDIEKTQHPRETENFQNLSVIQRQQNLSCKSVQSTDSTSTCISASRRELINRTRVTGGNQEFVEGGDMGAKEARLEVSLSETNNMKESVIKSSGQEIQGTNAVQMQSQLPKTKASMPQWTDEQLDELFACDDDDDSLFR